MIKGSKQTQRMVLSVALVIIVSGFVLMALELFKAIDAVRILDDWHLGFVLVVVGGVLVLFAPRPPRSKKKKPYRF